MLAITGILRSDSAIRKPDRLANLIEWSCSGSQGRGAVLHNYSILPLMTGVSCPKVPHLMAPIIGQVEGLGLKM
jgi:hypothetical protein